MQQKTNTIKTKPNTIKKKTNTMNKKTNRTKLTNKITIKRKQTFFLQQWFDDPAFFFMTSNSCRNPNKSQTAWPAHLRSLSAFHNKCSVLIYIYDR